MKVAVIQLRVENEIEKNIAKAMAAVRRAIAQRATFILLPELFIFSGVVREKAVSEIAEDIYGATTKIFSAMARRYKAYILLGSILEKIKKNQKYITLLFY